MKDRKEKQICTDNYVTEWLKVWDMKNVHTILVGKTVGKKSFGRLMHDGRIILK